MAMHHQTFRGESMELNAVTQFAVERKIAWSSAIRMMIVQACPEYFPPGYAPKVSAKDWTANPPVYKEDV